MPLRVLTYAVLILVMLLATGVQAQDGFRYGNGSAGANDTLNSVASLYQLYESGQIAEAEYQAFKMLDASPNLNRTDQANFHLILAFCAAANDDEDNSVRQFVQALRLNPNLSPDPVTWSPKIRRIFNKAYPEYLKELAKERSRRSAFEGELNLQASFRSLYLPGLGQISKQEKRKGITLLAFFGAGSAIFIYSQIELPRARNRYVDASTPQDAVVRWSHYRDTYRTAVISGALAVVIYLYSFADALWSPPRVPSQDYPTPESP